MYDITPTQNSDALWGESGHGLAGALVRTVCLKELNQGAEGERLCQLVESVISNTVLSKSSYGCTGASLLLKQYGMAAFLQVSAFQAWHLLGTDEFQQALRPYPVEVSETVLTLSKEHFAGTLDEAIKTAVALSA